jgi:methylthioribulose-1-phosphate dehydratase
MTTLLNEQDTRTSLAAVGREFYTRGWMLATAGNLSARLSDESYLITASGGHKGQLTDRDFIRFQTNMVSSEPWRKSSAETIVHDLLYQATAAADVGAILHVHAPYLTLVSRALAEHGEVYFEGWEYVKALGFWADGARVRMPIVPNHADLGALGRAVQEACSETPAVLVAGHGVYAWGATIADAQRHIEATECLCHLEWENSVRP